MNNRMMSGLYSLTEWITKFAFLNFLWIAFSLLGVILFGLLPSTVALFTVLRKWMMGETEFPLLPLFWNTYKAEFFKSNLLGGIFFLLGGLMYLNLEFMNANENQGLQVVHIPLYLIILAISMTVLYTIPVYVHYNIGLLQVFKNAFLIMLLNPLPNLMILVGTASTLFVMNALPALLLFFGASFTGAIIMAASYLAFQKIEKKQKEAQSI
ncbi:YesL family protein [Rossellomorea vietnamensis]|uniref:YesL family protein n=1 Tax=Rossellomorea vietnamensis TaxID=218284 RepID=UPI003CEA4765